MKTSLLILAFIMICFTFGFYSCTSDKLPELIVGSCGDSLVTYEKDIKTIIDSKCAFSGCHAGNQPPDLSTYTGLNAAVLDGTFEEEVLITGSMPLGDTLSTDQIELITCWKNDGFLEN